MVDIQTRVEIHRMQDHVRVAYLEVALHDQFQQARVANIEARHLSRVFGELFYVEVWEMYDFDPYNYTRISVFHNGRKVVSN